MKTNQTNHKLILLGLFTLVMTGCGDGWLLAPVSGPGLTDDGSLAIELADDETVVIATTYLVIQENSDSQDLFASHMEKVNASIAELPDGLIGHGLGQKLFSNEVRTLSVWESEEKLYTWLFNGAHMDAVNDASDIGEASVSKVVHWEAVAHEFPITWDVAVDRIESEGRRAY